MNKKETSDSNEARKKVYGDIKKIKFDRAFYRKDIGL